MTVMMLNGLLHCLLFMLTSAEMGPQSKLTAGLQMYGKESRVDIQARGKECRAIGGKCVRNEDQCPKGLYSATVSGSPYCSRRSRCCYPGPCITPEVCCSSEGCFYLYVSSQCFCILPGVFNADFSAAKAECKAKTWDLPHPADAVALRSAVVQLYGNCDKLWLNAKTEIDVFGMYWKDNDVNITTKNPLFATEPTFPVDIHTCLGIKATEEDWAAPDARDKPYFADECDTAQLHVLCERK